MGFLQTSDDIVNNVNKSTSNILNSKFTKFITGSGTPVLVTYYNVDDVSSTADNGTGTADNILGSDSPFRYNKIENLPVYGLKDLLPSKDEIDMGLIDLSLDGEIVILPNTIKPSPYDYLVYQCYENGPILTFRIDNFEFTTIKSNGYYRLEISIKDINDRDTIDKLERQIVNNYTAILDNIGTQDKCIINNNKLDTCRSIEGIIRHLMEQYVDTFWDKKFNSFLYKPEDAKFLVYDPFLTEFMRRNNLADLQDTAYIVLVNYDSRDEMRRDYNKSIYRNLENQDITKLYPLVKHPIQFPTTDTNPFYYYGSTTTFTLDLVKYDGSNKSSDKLLYIPLELIDRINNNDIINIGENVDSDQYFNTTELGLIENVSDYENVIFSRDENKNSRIYWNLIISYLNNGAYNLLNFSKVELKDLLAMEIDYSRENYIYLPIAVFILRKYLKFIINNK